MLGCPCSWASGRVGTTLGWGHGGAIPLVPPHQASGIVQHHAGLGLRQARALLHAAYCTKHLCHGPMLSKS